MFNKFTRFVTFGKEKKQEINPDKNLVDPIVSDYNWKDEARSLQMSYRYLNDVVQQIIDGKLK